VHLKFISAVVAGIEHIANLASTLLIYAAIPIGAKLTKNRLRHGRIRSLWGTTPILTLALKASSDRMLGMRSESAVLTNYYISNDFDWNLKWIIKASGPFRAPVLRLVLAAALLRYDIFHYFADRGILDPDGRFGIHQDELDALRRSGKLVYVFAYGADVRMRERTLALGKWNFCVDCDHPGTYCLCDDRAGEAILQRISDTSTATVSLGDMLTYFPRTYHVAYWPIDIRHIDYIGVGEHDRVLTIAHAPNHTHFKGTRYLEQSLERLRRRGIEFNLTVISGVSNDEVLRLLGKADIIADQFIGGSYGYTALEGLARGKPVLTYIRHSGLTVAADECPFINATPDTLDDVLTWCFHNRQTLQNIGRQGRAYIERHHSIPAVAARLARLYLDTADLPCALVDRFRSFIADEEMRKNDIPTYADWHHPWSLAMEARAAALQSFDP